MEKDGNTNIAFSLVPHKICYLGNGEDVKVDSNELVVNQMENLDEEGKARLLLYIPCSMDNFYEVKKFDTNDDYDYEDIKSEYIPKDTAKWSAVGYAVKAACNTQVSWDNFAKESQKGNNLSFRVSYRVNLVDDEMQKKLDENADIDEVTGKVTWKDGQTVKSIKGS